MGGSYCRYSARFRAASLLYFSAETICPNGVTQRTHPPGGAGEGEGLQDGECSPRGTLWGHYGRSGEAIRWEAGHLAWEGRQPCLCDAQAYPLQGRVDVPLCVSSNMGRVSVAPMPSRLGGRVRVLYVGTYPTSYRLPTQKSQGQKFRAPKNARCPMRRGEHDRNLVREIPRR